MKGADDTFSAIHTEVRLNSFLSSLDLHVGQCLDLVPIVSEYVIKVDRILSWFELRLLIHVHPSNRLLLHLVCQFLSEGVSFPSRLGLEENGEDELRVVQDALINERVLHQGRIQILHFLHLCILNVKLVLFLLYCLSLLHLQ